MTSKTAASLIALSVAVLPLLSCFSDRSSITEPAGGGCEVPASAIGAGQTVVFIRNFAFFPQTVRISPGTRVTWVNCESASVEPHTTTATDAAWNSGPIAPGESYAETFTATGINSYFCQPHPSMTGSIIVE